MSEINSCLNCIHGAKLDEWEELYFGGCQHWEKAIRDQIVQVHIDDGPPNKADLQKVASECPAWESISSEKA